MSERVYALFLRLYPSSFRTVYGDEAMLLFRDRANDERGLVKRLRLWMDILADAIVSLPREYGRPAATRPCATTDPTVSAFQLAALPSGAPPASAILCGGLVSLVLFGTLFLWVAHGRSYRLAHPLPGPTKASLQAAVFSRPVEPEVRQAGMSALLPGKSAQFVRLSFVGNDDNRGFSPLPAAAGNGQPQPSAQMEQPKVQDASAAIIEALGSHDIVMFGEAHGNKQEYEWLCKLVENDQFADHVDDIVVEFGNSLYQKSVDRYIAAEDIPIEQVEKAWRNVIGAVGPPSPVYGLFYKAVRDANMKRRGKHQIRIVLGDPYGNWESIKDAEDLGPYLAHRDDWYAQVVKDEVLAKHHRALLIMGSGHFIRRNGFGLVERTIRAAGANPYLVVFGTNVTGGYGDLDRRFDAWPVPAIVALAGNWVGELPAMPVINGGTTAATPLKLTDAADALLYVGSRDSLTELRVPRSELDGTPYGNELNRRLMIFPGHLINFLYDQTEVPQFRSPQPQASPQSNQGGPPAMPPPPKSIHDQLPPRPASQ